MKCINKWICLSLLIAVSCVSGCGKTSAAIEQPYDVYATAADFGLSSNGTAEAKSYFASNLCVSEDVAIGTDSTDSQVAEGAGTFNLETNTVVYAKNLYERLYPASTTKILTAYIALKYCDDLDAMVTVSENAVNQASDSSVCNLKAGDVIRLRDLLYGLMLRSGNDAAVAIAEYISGDVDSFAALMNQEAAAMGATRSHFVNPNGLPDENHYTCVYDMYLIFPMQSKRYVCLHHRHNILRCHLYQHFRRGGDLYVGEHESVSDRKCDHTGRIPDCRRQDRNHGRGGLLPGTVFV